MARFGGTGSGLWYISPLLLSLLLSCDASDPMRADDPSVRSGQSMLLEINPGTATIPLVGQSVKLDAVVRNAKGQVVRDALVLWETNAPMIAMVNADGTVTGLRVGSALIRARVGNLSASALVQIADTPFPISAERLRIEPNGDTIPLVGGTVQLKAAAYDAQHRLVDGPTVAWFSLDPLVASVVNGSITGRGKGAARILITNGSLADTAVVWVQPTSTVARVSIRSDQDTLWALGDTARVQAIALDPAGNAIPDEVLTLTVLDPSIVMIDDQSNVVATGSGTARIAANYGKTSDTTSLAVAITGGTSSVTITPKSDTIPKVGDTVQLTATTDGSAKVKWQSLDPYATMASEGEGTVIGLRQGVARIVAKAGSASDTAIVWIAPAPASAKAHSVVVQPVADTIAVVGGTVQLTSMVLDSQGSPIADQTVSWSTPNAGLVQVSGAGTVKGISAGVALVMATAAGTTVSDTATIWVAPVPVQTAIQIDPGSDTIPDIGTSITLDAEAVDANGNVMSPANAMWQSLDPTVAQVASSGTPSSNMLVTGRGKGIARIVATQQSMVDTAWVIVDQAPPPPTPTSVRVTPRTDTIAIGGTAQLTGVVLDQSGNVMAGLAVAWQPLNPAIATVNGSGLVQGTASGVARVRAYYGTFADTARITVNSTPSPTPPTYAVPSSIDATGQTDVTDQLNAFFSSVPDGSTITFRPGTVYRAEGTLLLMDRNDLTFEGNGATIVQRTDGSGTSAAPGTGWVTNWPRNRSIWAALRGSNIRWNNFVLKGANANAGLSDEAFVVELEAQHGFDIGSTHGVEIANVTVTDVYGDFIYVGLAYRSTTWARNVHVHHNHFERNGRQGIGIANGEDMLFENNYIGEVRRASIDIEPNGAAGGARRVTFRNNTFGPGRLTWFASAGKGGIAEDIALEYNTLIGKAAIIIVKPPEGTRRARFRVIGNVSDMIHGSNQPLMQFHRVDGVVVRNNVNPLAAGRDMTGVYVTESCSVDVSGNTFINALNQFVVDSFAGCS